MDIVQQVQVEADRIVRRDGTWSSAIPLCVLYAETLEAVLGRVQQMQDHIDPVTYAFLLAPVKGRVDG